MTHATNSQGRLFKKVTKFQKFVFIGNTSIESPSFSSEQLGLTPNSDFLNQVDVGSSLTITQLHTPGNITRQLRDLQFKPGETIQLVSRTANGSVVVSSDNRSIGMGAEIARRIIVTLAQRAK